MQKRTTARKTSFNREALKGALLIVGLAAWAAVEGAAGRHVAQSDGVKHERRLFDVESEKNAGRLAAGERKKVVDHVERVVERGLKAKYRRPPVNPSDDEVTRIMQDVEQLAESELAARYGHLVEDDREAIKKCVRREFQRSLESHRAAAEMETRIEHLQGLSNGELEKKAQAGDPYAQYALGKRIRSKIDGLKSSANGRKLDDYTLLDYAGQSLLVAAETAIEKKMHWHFRDRVADQLSFWHLTAHYFHAPILKDPEFSRRWETVKRKLKYPIPGISEEP